MDDVTLNSTPHRARNKTVGLDGTILITNWNEIKIAQPENLAEKIGGLKETKKLIKAQKQTESSLSTFSLA